MPPFLLQDLVNLKANSLFSFLQKPLRIGEYQLKKLSLGFTSPFRGLLKLKSNQSQIKLILAGGHKKYYLLLSFEYLGVIQIAFNNAILIQNFMFMIKTTFSQFGDEWSKKKIYLKSFCAQ